jgi:adenylate kinase
MNPRVGRADPLRALLLGPPGSGKGTQGARLAARHQVPHLSTGELLRGHVRRGTALGQVAGETMNRGDLIADDLIIAMVLDEVLGPNSVGGFVLDGFPRTVPQAVAAYDVARRHDVTLHIVILLDIPLDQLVARLIGRGETSGRPDDTSETIHHRIAVYRRETAPLIDYYAGRSILVTIDAAGTIDEVAASIHSAVDRVPRPLL